MNVDHEADDVETLCTVNVDQEMQMETGGERCNNLGNNNNIILYRVVGGLYLPLGYELVHTNN